MTIFGRSYGARAVRRSKQENVRFRPKADIDELMDAPIFGLVFGGLMTAMVVIPRVLAWISGLMFIFQAPEPTDRRVARSLGQFFLHSGPWLLTITIGAIYYVASLSEPRWLWALIAGFGLGAALLGGAIAVAYARRRKPAQYEPVTPELFARKRRRFLWTNSFVFGGSMFLLMIYERMVPIDQVATVVMFGFSLGGGWLWSWFMWQFVGAELLGREERRKFFRGNKEKDWAP